MTMIADDTVALRQAVATFAPSLALIGDIHGDWPQLHAAMRLIERQHPEVKHIIQVGDFGVWPTTVPVMDVVRPIKFIGGNHEHDDMLHDPRGWGLDAKHPYGDNVTYIPRGKVLELSGKRVGFLGGGDSVDQMWREQGVSWFPKEAVTAEDVDKLIANVGHDPIDLLVTHEPPAEVMHSMKKARILPSWADEAILEAKLAMPSGMFVQRAWEQLGFPDLVCGHMHISYRLRNARVLAIGEVCYA